MIAKIVWSKTSKLTLKNIKVYYTELASLKVAKKIILGIISKTKNLIDNPFQGQKDLFLEFKNEDFRYLVYKNYKIIYKIESKELIRIYDVFDCRQDPEKLENISE